MTWSCGSLSYHLTLGPPFPEEQQLLLPSKHWKRSLGPHNIHRSLAGALQNLHATSQVCSACAKVCFFRCKATCCVEGVVTIANVCFGLLSETCVPNALNLVRCFLPLSVKQAKRANCTRQSETSIDHIFRKLAPLCGPDTARGASTDGRQAMRLTCQISEARSTHSHPPSSLGKSLLWSVSSHWHA